MSGENIEVNYEVIENELSNLKNLINEIDGSGISLLEIQGDGFTKQCMNLVDNAFI